MSVTRVVDDGLEKGRSYSRAVIVDGNCRTVYLAGVPNLDRDRRVVSGSFERAARACFDRLRDSIEACGGRLSDIVTMTVYLTNPRWGDEFVKIRSEYFDPGCFPASTLVTVAALGYPDLVIEIQAVAVIESAASASGTP